MKSLTLITSIALLATPFTVFAGPERYSTATHTATTYATNGNDYAWGATNRIEIAQGESGELICLERDNAGATHATVTKNGVTVTARPASYLYNSGSATPRGTTVAGPATFTLTSAYGTGGPPPTPDYAYSALMTVKIEPESFPPGQTIILPEGTVGVIHVESSTNLIAWQDEWVHTFSNTNQNRFFRLRAERSLP